jgi:hypothetical protein
MCQMDRLSCMELKFNKKILKNLLTNQKKYDIIHNVISQQNEINEGDSKWRLSIL